jgi:uncharacterized membrane protein YagU involved in acid resistance
VQRRLDLKAATLAGLAAAIVSTAIEILLWRACAFPLPETLFRDARLAAAIVLGVHVLPPPATFDWQIMIVATCLHVALSIVYTFVLAAAVCRLSTRDAVAAGALFGLLLYGVNMYGFTRLFPWFALTRDGITAVAHVAFGVTASATYIGRRRLIA